MDQLPWAAAAAVVNQSIGASCKFGGSEYVHVTCFGWGGKGGCMHAAWDELEQAQQFYAVLPPRHYVDTANYRLWTALRCAASIFRACTPCVDVAACALAQNIQWWLNSIIYRVT